jgi:hypothetical protein
MLALLRIFHSILNSIICRLYRLAQRWEKWLGGFDSSDFDWPKLHIDWRIISSGIQLKQSSAWLIFRFWRWRQSVPLKLRLTFNWLHGVVSQKISLFMTTVARTDEGVRLFTLLIRHVCQMKAYESHVIFSLLWLNWLLLVWNSDNYNMITFSQSYCLLHTLPGLLVLRKGAQTVMCY